MLVRVWEYEVAPGCEAEFEQLYGSTGAWAQLFARSAGHHAELDSRCAAVTTSKLEIR